MNDAKMVCLKADGGSSVVAKGEIVEQLKFFAATLRATCEKEKQRVSKVE